MFYNLIKDFQSGLVGILGFIGVIITLLFNAHSAEQTKLQERNQARQTLQSALREELRSIDEELEKISDAAQRKYTFVFTLEQPYVYRALVKDIGTLQPDTADKVIRVYRDLYLAMNALRGMASNPDQAVVKIKPDLFQEAVGVVAFVKPELDETIKALE